MKKQKNKQQKTQNKQNPTTKDNQTKQNSDPESLPSLVISTWYNFCVSCRNQMVSTQLQMVHLTLCSIILNILISWLCSLHAL